MATIHDHDEEDEETKMVEREGGRGGKGEARRGYHDNNDGRLTCQQSITDVKRES